MKFFTMLFLTAVCSFNILISQTVINSTDFTLTNGQQNIYHSIDVKSLTGLELGPDINWDLTEIPLMGDSFVELTEKPPVTMSFPTATHAVYTMFGFPSIGYIIPTVVFLEHNQEGFYELGSMHAETKINLNEDGTAYAEIKEQSTVFQPNGILVTTFPMQYSEDGGLETEPVHRDVNLTITIPDMLTDAPLTYRRYESAKFEPVAWGKLSLKSYPGDLDVVGYKKNITGLDSFFLYGMPAPEPLLQAFGLVQGRQDNWERIDFFAKGLPLSVLELHFEDGKVYMAYQLENPAMSAEDESVSLSPAAYPNPSTGSITIDTKDFPDAEQITIHSVQGVLLSQQQVKESINTINLTNAPNGTYMYIVRSGQGRILKSGKFSLTK
ncbi:MAG: T9SS type A sorting domain-containing protein [Candidatus Kapaibacterium sp.]|jgi:hypothetical protein|nr:T9SS type A sorting domain-containing protein [Candidatus Kapabacteria bacterium]